MTLATLLAYSGALFVAAAIPRPGMTAIVARALGSGFRPTFLMGLGLILGDLCSQTFTTPFLIIKYLGALYLVYIAWKLWTAGLIAQNIEAKRSTSIGLSFLSGLLVTLGNPKTMLFYVALVPTLIPLEQIDASDYLVLVGATFIVLMAVLIPYIMLATQARMLLKKPDSLRTLNRSAASILAGTAAYIAIRG
jgi:threonine/homoserine/homoserine lactone efflux protein